MLKLPQNILQQIIDQAEAEAPVEACGILAGAGETIDKYYPMTNTDAATDHFMMEPAEQFAVVKDIRQNNLEMLAIAHSHPETPARPSEEDLRLALTPNVVYVIISLMNKDQPEVRGFLIDGANISKLPIEVL